MAVAPVDELHHALAFFGQIGIAAIERICGPYCAALACNGLGYGAWVRATMGQCVGHSIKFFRRTGLPSSALIYHGGDLRQKIRPRWFFIGPGAKEIFCP